MHHNGTTKRLHHKQQNSRSYAKCGDTGAHNDNAAILQPRGCGPSDPPWQWSNYEGLVLPTGPFVFLASTSSATGRQSPVVTLHAVTLHAVTGANFCGGTPSRSRWVIDNLVPLVGSGTGDDGNHLFAVADIKDLVWYPWLNKNKITRFVLDHMFQVRTIFVAHMAL